MVSSGVGAAAPGFAEAGVAPTEGRRLEPEGFGGMAGVFDDDAHAVMAVVVGEVAHDPDAGVLHVDDGGDAFGGAEPEDGDGGGSGHRVSVERDDFEGVAGEREAADLGGAGVDDVEEDALAGFDADGLAVAEHSCR